MLFGHLQPPISGVRLEMILAKPVACASSFFFGGAGSRTPDTADMSRML